jgi:hypothetical protein
MSIPLPNVIEFRQLVHRFQQAGWLQEGTMSDVLDIGSFSLRLSPKGVERLKSLHPILVKELAAPSAAELSALVWLLDDCQRKYYPNG